jgi:hypothetical protein
MNYGFDYIMQLFGPTPLLIFLVGLIVLILVCLFSLTPLRSKLIEWIQIVDKWYLELGNKLHEIKDKADQTKRVPCKLCGTKHYFYHPFLDVKEETINLCEQCASNPEGWSEDWLELPKFPNKDHTANHN